MTLRSVRWALWGLVGFVAAFLATVTIYQGLRLSATSGQGQGSGQAAIGGPFQLSTLQGKAFSNADVAGRPFLVFFGFTHCPDICPTTLYELTGLFTELGDAAKPVVPLFITVDPERDTAEMLTSYMTAFDPRIVALRGDGEQTAAALKAFAAYAAKVPGEAGDYTIEHTAGVILMNADGTFAGKLDMHEARDAQLAKLRRLAGT